MSLEDELRTTIATVARVLDELGVAWAIGGSFASTVYGEPRGTNNVDIVASLKSEHVDVFVQNLGDDFYADRVSIRQAVMTNDSFNLIDERSFFKVDVFVPPRGPLGEGQLQRRRRYALTAEGPEVSVLGPEDIVLQKLRWYRLGGGVSERQLRDVRSVVGLTPDLDLAYLRETARAAGMGELLDEILAESGRQA